MSAHRGFFFLEPLSLIDCCVQECSFFNSKLDSRVISNGSSLQSRGILLCDRHGLSTDRDLGESKNDSKEEGDPLPALPPYSFRSHFEKKKTKNKTKQKSLFCMQAIFLVHQSTTTRYLFNALFQSTVTLTLISQLLL